MIERQRARARYLLLAAVWITVACEPAAPPPGSALERAAVGWPAYGGDPGGTRHVTWQEITPGNVADLEVAWVYHTGDVSDGGGEWTSESAFEATQPFMEEHGIKTQDELTFKSLQWVLRNPDAHCIVPSMRSFDSDVMVRLPPVELNTPDSVTPS